MDAIDYQILRLEYELEQWEEEYRLYGSKGTAKRNASAMNAADLAFLKRQIARLHRTKKKALLVAEEVKKALLVAEEVKNAVEKHVSRW